MIPFNLILSGSAPMASASTGKNGPSGKVAELISTADGDVTTLDPKNVRSFLEWIQTILGEPLNPETGGELTLDDDTIPDEGELAELPLDQLQALIADAMAQAQVPPEMPSPLQLALQMHGGSGGCSGCGGSGGNGDTDAAMTTDGDADAAPSPDAAQTSPAGRGGLPNGVPVDAAPAPMADRAQSGGGPPDIQLPEEDRAAAVVPEVAGGSSGETSLADDELPAPASGSVQESRRAQSAEMDRPAAADARPAPVDASQPATDADSGDADESSESDPDKPSAHLRERVSRLSDSSQKMERAQTDSSTGGRPFTEATNHTPSEPHATSGVSSSDTSSPVADRPTSGAMPTAGGAQGQAAAALPQAEAATAKAFETTVMDQIVAKSAVRSIRGRSEIRIQLKPEFLGNVQMNISTDKEQLMVRVLTDRPAVKEIIETHLHQLRTELHHQGLTIDKFDVVVNQGADSQQGRDPFSQMFRQHSSQDQRRQSNPQTRFAWEQEDDPAAHVQEVAQRDGVNYFA